MALKKNILLLCVFSCMIIFITCRKPKHKPAAPAVIPEEFICEDTAFNWSPFPPEPAMGWQFHSDYGGKSPWRVVYDPRDYNTIYYLTQEYGPSTNKLWKYNRILKTKTLLDAQVLNNMDISTTGWLVYEKIDRNIYKIKINGDSLTQLTHKGGFAYPYWSKDGSYIYIYHDKPTPTEDKIIKIKNDGTIIDTVKNISVSSKIYFSENYLYYFQVVDGEYRLIQKDLNNQNERVIVSNANHNGEPFFHFFTDNANRVLYWYGFLALYKTDLTTLQTTKVINSGYHSRNNILHYRQSQFNKRFIAIQFNKEVSGPYSIKSSAKIVEFTEDGLCKRTVEIPD